ncbi:dihydrolipoamide acetyltransferase family protein [Nocardioides sp. JS614]|uniref:dihydrolipoamide acetyltransferase family protein n=1 Tax=Nocardioides sp. (strain ATCC BAA-499 / JS614) TaxID=196162 RepID=UPI0005A28222|nr:dihydrolipoamide acetyltransferase family protein [Nocardioides sp. JS614]
MPEVAANATEAVLAEWLVSENAEFGALDTIATVETEKALVDVEAEDAGVVLKTLVPPGALVEVGAPIAVLGAPGEAVGDLGAVLAELGVAEPVDHVLPERRSLVEPVDPVVEPVEAPAPTQGSNHRVFASPLARRLARLAEIPVEEIAGTGPRGRILRRDVEAAVAARPATPVVEQRAPASVVETPAPTQGSASKVEPVDVPHSRLRRAVANRLAESKQTAPHFYLRATVRADRLVDLRAELNEGAETRVSLNDLVVKAVAAAHARVPEMNVVWTPDAVRSFSSVDVAVAVATDRGLVTPVLRDVTSLTVTAVAAKVQDLAARAREGRLKQDELEGGTISVTNLGMYGVEEFAAIINPPHAAILAVGAVREEPVVEDGAVVPGKVLTVTLSVDHRPVDGVVAARWLAAFVDLVEHPARILA